MKPRIESLQEKKLVGKSLQMSFSNIKSYDLWRSFMPVRKEIKNAADNNLYSAEVYPAGFFENYDPDAPFTKWAAVEVLNFDTVPEGLETLILPAGLCAVFLHKGAASRAVETYNYIFREWLPNSAYLLDDRPHFAVMDEKYKRDDESSEEEIWIPICEKGA